MKENLEAEAAVSRNIQRVMTDDGPPRLRSDMEQCVLAKDTKAGSVLIGGLGVMGVGSMWFTLRDSHRAYPGWDEAPDLAGLYPDDKELTVTVRGKVFVLPFHKVSESGVAFWRTKERKGLVVSQVRAAVGKWKKGDWGVCMFGPWHAYPGHEPSGGGPTLQEAVKDFEAACDRWVAVLNFSEP